MSATKPAPAKAEGQNGAKPPEPDFPLETFRDAARHLRRPFTTNAVRFKVQATWPKDNPTGGLIVTYIDARLVVERLNYVLPDKWHDTYEPLDKNLMVCRLTVDGITREDVGEGTGKGLRSDSLKRAAVKFGIGVPNYAVPKMILDVESGALKRRQASGRATLELTPKGETAVRKLYADWLTAHGIPAFGEPLDHGDVEGSVGDPDDAPSTVAVGDAQEPEPEAGPSSDVVAELEAMAQDLRDGGEWTGKELRTQLVAAGATDTSSVGAALRTLTEAEADVLRSRMADLLAARDGS